MRKLLFTALLTITVVAGAFAKDPNKINAAVLNSFKVEFKNVSDVEWAVRQDYAKATFVLDNRKTEVFYDKNGEKIATSQRISLDDLPLKAKREFARKFEGYTAKEAIFFESPDESSYYISGEDGKQSVIFKVDENGRVLLYKKSKK